MATALLGDRTRTEVWAGPIVDVDVHAVIPSIGALLPYLSDVWRQHIGERQWAGPPDWLTYPPALQATARPEWRPADGRQAATDVSLLQKDLLDPWRVDTAIVNCHYGVDTGHPDTAAALASAINDWLIAEWLDKDDRLRASIVIPGRDPKAMAKEIDRVGGHPGFVQVLMPVRSGRLYGQRIFHPVYEAIVRNDLVMGMHWGGLNDGAAPTTSGWPSWYAEEYAGEQQVYEAQVLSMVAEGVFKAFPDLRVAVLESGFAWLPTWCWRMDKEWKGMRREVPWVDRSPFSIIRDHMRFSTAPLDCESADELAPIIEWLGSDELLMFATDYPHAHDDDLGVLIAATPDAMRPKLMAESARAWYHL
jgi:predicted TIM-barrel fold metal-dependent hydrolase